MTLTENMTESPSPSTLPTEILAAIDSSGSETQRLALYRYVRGTTLLNELSSVCAGRLATDDRLIIFWPHLYDRVATTLRHLVALLFAPSARKSLLALSSRPRPRQLGEVVRKRVERLAAPVLLAHPVDVHAGAGQYRAAYLRIAGTPMEVAGGETEDLHMSAQETFEQLQDPDNFTVLSRVMVGKKAAARTSGELLPFHEADPDAVEVPLLAMHLWLILQGLYQPRMRDEFAFPMVSYEHRGAWFLPSGHILINWRVLLSESMWWTAHVRPLPYNATEIRHAIEEQPLFRTLRRALVSRDFGETRNGVSVNASFSERLLQESQYLTLCKQSPNFQVDEVQGPDPCTIIDPLKLPACMAVFRGALHRRLRLRRERKERLKERYGRAPSPKATIEAKGLPRVRVFEFTPSQFLSPAEQGDLWFERSTTERIYAIQKRKELCFTRPSLLSAAQNVRGSEVEVWLRAMEKMRLVEVWSKTGDVVDVKVPFKSEYFKHQTTEHLRQFAAERYREDFESAPRSVREQAKAKASEAWAAQRFQNGDDQDVNWYWSFIRKMSRDYFDGRQGVVRATVSIDGAAPEPKVFYREYAISHIARLADASFHRVTLQDEGDRSLHEIDRSAPYVLAWTRFCRQVTQGVFAREVLPSRSDSSSRIVFWGPYEDYQLAYAYRSYPRLTEEEWDVMLQTLGTRTKRQCIARVSYLRKQMKRVTTSDTARRCGLDAAYQNDLEAKRAVLITGFIRYMGRYHDKRHIYPRDPSFAHLFHLSEDFLQKVVLPSNYESQDFFRRFVRR